MMWLVELWLRLLAVTIIVGVSWLLWRPAWIWNDLYDRLYNE